MPDARKCACASHVAKIAEFFQVGNARDGDWACWDGSLMGFAPVPPRV